jgi:hypothetical protein
LWGEINNRKSTQPGRAQPGLDLYTAFLQHFPAKIKSLMPNFRKRLEEPTIINRFFNKSEFFGFWRAADLSARQGQDAKLHITCQRFGIKRHITCHGVGIMLHITCRGFGIKLHITCQGFGIKLHIICQVLTAVCQITCPFQWLRSGDWRGGMCPGAFTYDLTTTESYAAGEDEDQDTVIPGSQTFNQHLGNFAGMSAERRLAWDPYQFV